jgi:O-antigen ligase
VHGPARVALTLMALAPLAVIPGGASAFVLGKLLVVALAVVATAAAPPSGRLARPVVALLAAGSCLLVASALASSSPVAALFGRWPRYEGLIALPLYVAAGWAGARLLGPGASAGVWRVLHSALSVTALIVAGTALLEAMGARPLGGEGMRSGSFQGNATEMGLLGLVLLAVLTPAALRRRQALVISGAAAAILMVTLSGSRAAYLGTLVVVVGLALTERSATAEARRRIAVIGAGLTTMVVLVLVVPSSRERLLSLATVSGRAQLWSQTVAMVRDHPIWGAGPSGYVDAIVPYFTLDWATSVGMQNPPDSPHLWPLQAASAGGVALGVLACATALVTMRIAVRQWRRAAPDRRAELVGPGLAVLGYGVALLTHFTAAGTTPLVALLAGACIAEPLAASRRMPVPRRPPGRRPAEPASASRKRPLDLLVVPAVLWGVVAATLTVVLSASVAAEWSLSTASRSMARGEVDGVESAYSTARRLRPWDIDIASQATQVFAAMASAGAPGAAARSVEWGAVAHRGLPDSLQVGLARAVGLRLAGDSGAATDQLDQLHARSPYDPQVLLQRGVLRRENGDIDGARDDLSAASRLDPLNPVIRKQLALVTDGEQR